MNDVLYLSQVVVIGTTLLFICRASKYLQLQILCWSLLTCVIALRYGVSGQRIFYSNDQRYHAELVENILANGLPIDVDWWLQTARIPYVLPATAIALAGIEPLLALKLVSLLALLGLTSRIQSTLALESVSRFLVLAFFTSTASIGVFFSALGLRETTMMLFVFLFFFGVNPATRYGALLCLLLLRPHLAAAVLLGTLIVATIQRLRNTSSSTPIRNFAWMVGGPLIGHYVYSVGLEYQTGLQGIYGHSWGIQPVLRIVSNFVGLQFLTANNLSLEFSLSSLLLLRIIFSETVLIPLCFTIAVLLSRQQSRLMQSVLLSFGIYVGIATNTDLNSFRQNIPFMPVMGFIVLLIWRGRNQT
ncbi:MAG: hypothetical protein EBW14_08670, partial [Oxalobacteraceae bacterium]|nr:hypothetical protein [Oxalobacteraceae bacterium]